MVLMLSFRLSKTKRLWLCSQYARLR